MEQKKIEDLIVWHYNTLYSTGSIVRLTHPELKLNCLYCALTDKGRVFLIETDSSETPFKNENNNPERSFSGNIRMSDFEFAVEGVNRRFIAIFCRKKNLVNLFSRLMADITWNLINEGPESRDPWNFIYERLEGWKLLFSGRDSLAEEKGLLGELIVLKHLLERYCNVDVWSGPIQGTKDFRLPDQNIEVKTTAVRYGYEVQFSGVFQMLNLQKYERLVFLRIAQAINGKHSVKQMIDEIATCLTTASQREYFLKLLDEYSESARNSDKKWELLESVVFEVDDSFPRITNKSFENNCIPEGILEIKYTADLSGLPRNNMSEFDFLNVS